MFALKCCVLLEPYPQSVQGVRIGRGQFIRCQMYVQYASNKIVPLAIYGATPRYWIFTLAVLLGTIRGRDKNPLG